jgi:hypothetical protein
MLQNIRTEAILDPTCDGFVYCHGTVTQIPKGFCLKARGCEERATPGPRPSRFNLEEVVASRDMDLQPDVWCSGDNGRNSVGVERYGGLPLHRCAFMLQNSRPQPIQGFILDPATSHVLQ